MDWSPNNGKVIKKLSEVAEMYEGQSKKHQKVGLRKFSKKNGEKKHHAGSEWCQKKEKLACEVM